MEEKIHILLIDDQPLYRQGVKRMMEGDLQLCLVGEHTDTKTIAECYQQSRPDVVLLELGLEGNLCKRRLPPARTDT